MSRADSGALLPFYLLVDISASMGMAGADGRSPLGSLNEALPVLHDAVATDPIVADKVRFSILTFSDVAAVALPLVDLDDVEFLPELHARSETSYVAGLALLRAQIEHDVALLEADGFVAYQPVVFLVSDGMPTDDPSEWRGAVAALHDAEWAHRPRVITFGLGDADPEVLRTVATVRAFTAEDGEDPSTVISEFVGELTKSIVRSGRGHPGQLYVPERIGGVVSIDIGFSVDEGG